MRVKHSGRQCRRCGDPIHWGAARLVGARAYCSEACAIIALADETSRTAWNRAALEMARGPRDLRRRVRLALAGWRATQAQRRLDRRLDAGPGADLQPWIWAPSAIVGSPPRVLAGLILVLGVWGATGGLAPETGATIPFPAIARAGLDSPNALAPPREPSASIGVIPPAPPPEPREVAPTLVSLPPAERSAAIPVPRPGPAVPLVAEDFSRGNAAIREIAFTFDGHDASNVTEEILDMLQARGVHATMFLGGQFIRHFPDLVRRMVADGHEIGSHLDTHPHLTTYARNHRHETLPGVTQAFLFGELRRVEASFRALTGRPMAPYWRAPYGEHNAELRAWAAEADYRHVGWTRGAGTAEDLDTRDWVADTSSRIYRSREEIAARILEFGRDRPAGLNGGIVLMHLSTQRRTDRPHESLPPVLKTLQSQGYRLVTVSELLEHAVPRQARVSPGAAPRPSSSAQALVQ